MEKNPYIQEYLENYSDFASFDEFIKVKRQENNEKLKRDLISMLNPPNLTIKEKFYYWTASLADIPLKVSILGSLFSGGDSDWFRAAGVNTALYFGSIFLLQHSYNYRNKEELMNIKFNPSIDFGSKTYSLFKES